MTKKQKIYLQKRAENIRSMVKEDPERHPMAIIATTGLTFRENLLRLYHYCFDTKQQDICDLLLDNTSIKP